MHEIKNFFIFIVMALFFFVLSFSIPFMGVFFLPLAAVFITFLFIKNGHLLGVLGTIILFWVIYKFIPNGNVFCFVFPLFVMLNSLFLYYGITKKKHCWRIILDSCIAISSVFSITVLSFVINGSHTEWITKISSNFPKDIPDAIYKVVTDNIYSVIIIFIIISVVLSYIFLSSLSKRFNINIEKIQSFGYWRLPEKFIFAFIFSLLMHVVSKQIKSAVLLQISGNMLNVIFFLYFIGGLSIGKHFFGKSKVLLLVSYVFFLFYSPSAVFLGVSDVWFNFRKKREDEKNEGHLNARD